MGLGRLGWVGSGVQRHQEFLLLCRVVCLLLLARLQAVAGRHLLVVLLLLWGVEGGGDLGPLDETEGGVSGLVRCVAVCWLVWLTGRWPGELR